MKPPQQPAKMPEYAEVCLHALAARGLGHAISVGGGLGLLHYLDYRETHGWIKSPTPPSGPKRSGCEPGLQESC
jgi:hypothetical protein